MNVQSRVTKHAQERMQQRGISKDIAGYIECYGVERKAPGGATVMFLDRGSLTEIKNEVGQRRWKKMANKLKGYIVIEDAKLVTVGHQKNKFYQH